MPRRTLAALFTLGAMTLPASPAAAGCTPNLPVTDDRAGSYSCTGVHPGMGLLVPSKKWGETTCTAGFAFTDQQKNRYLTFPGTCHLDYECLEDTVTELLPPPLNEVRLPTCLVMSESEEEPVYKRGGPVVRDLEGRRVGAIVYAVNKDDVNFAVMRLDRSVRLDPALPVYGGPVRFGSPTGGPEEAYAFSAEGMPGAINARTGVLYMPTADAYHQTEGFTSVADGSPVMKPDGSAVGYYGFGWTVGFGWRLHSYGPALARTAKVPRINLRLMTAKLR